MGKAGPLPTQLHAVTGVIDISHLCFTLKQRGKCMDRVTSWWPDPSQWGCSPPSPDVSNKHSPSSEPLISPSIGMTIAFNECIQ